MERTIYDIMTNDPAKIQEFIAACDEMLGSSYILADGRISSILQSIATSKILYALFGRILEKFDYKEAAKSCKTEDGNPVKITLPVSDEECAAFVFCVLLDIDKQNINLKDFLQFFGEQDSPSSFKIFLSDFIQPFKKATLAILEKEQSEKEQKKQLENKETERKQLEQNFDRFMGTFIARINSDEQLSTILKDDLSVLCGSFLKAVHDDDTKESRVLYSKLIKKLRVHKPALARELEKFDIENI